MNIHRPVISGIGLVTPLGATVSETWDALLTGRYIEDHAKVSLGFDSSLPRVSALAVHAAREATQDRDVRDSALVVATSKGPVECWLSQQGTRGSRVAQDMSSPPSGLSDLGRTVRLGLGAVACDVADRLGIAGPRLTVSTACASGLHALIRGCMLIQSGQFSRVLVVAAEASVHPMFLASFARLGVLSPAGLGCRPFDRSRAGFLMSEAAAAVLLENRESAGQVVVERFALGADANHLTGIDPQAVALRHTLSTVLANGPTQLLHAHGTGTQMNDALELAALDELTPSAVPPAIIYSHKGALGHSLGAAGLISVVLNFMSHRTGLVLPNVRTSNPLPARRVAIPRGISRRSVERSVAVAAGFGGAMAVVSLHSVD